MNAKYPPTVKGDGPSFGGYPTSARETLFYDFAVNDYDVSFKYKGKPYWLAYLVDHVAAYDDSVPDKCEIYPHANALIENFEIDGHKLIDIIDELEDVQPE